MELWKIWLNQTVIILLGNRKFTEQIQRSVSQKIALRNRAPFTSCNGNLNNSSPFYKTRFNMQQNTTLKKLNGPIKLLYIPLGDTFQPFKTAFPFFLFLFTNPVLYLPTTMNSKSHKKKLTRILLCEYLVNPTFKTPGI